MIPPKETAGNAIRLNPDKELTASIQIAQILKSVNAIKVLMKTSKNFMASEALQRCGPYLLTLL